MLDRRVFGNVSFEHCLYALIIAVAIFTRLYESGPRPLHHDESIHAVFSWKIVTEGAASYKYDPVYHGPVLYFWTALVFRLFGDSDFTSRLSPNLFGLAIIAGCWFFRRYLGRSGALALAVLMTLSPSWVYFTRFLRHDIYVALFNVGFVYFAFRYGETRIARYLYAAFACLSLAFATKEDMYALAPIFVVSFVFMLVWEVVYAYGAASTRRAVLAEVGEFLRRAALPLFTGSVIFVAIWVVFYSSLFNHPDRINGVTPALQYWLGQHEIQRIGGPWYYYFPHLLIYEQLIFVPALLFLLGPLFQPRRNESSLAALMTYAALVLAAGAIIAIYVPSVAPYASYVLIAAATLAGLVHMQRWLPDRFTRFTIVWTMGNFVFYSWAQEKVPWLLVPILTPMTLLAAIWVRQMIDWRYLTKPLIAVPAAALSAFTVWSLIASNYLYDAPHPEEDPERRHAELLAYVQSTYDVHTKVMRRIDDISSTLGTGTQTRLAISGDATWPLSWYVRHYPVNWGAGLRRVDTPVLIVDLDAAKGMEAELSEKYDQTRFQIRGWWEPNWSQANIPKMARYLFTREVFSPVGSSDAVMFALKAVEPGMEIGTVEVNPPPPPRAYPGAAAELAPAAVWGHQGSGLGEFNEPRGIAVGPGGVVYVVDSKNNRVQKLGPDGTPLLTWGSVGEGDGQLKDPCGITASADGSVYVADTWNHRVQKFDANGRFIWQARPDPGFWGPRGIAVAPDGSRIYLTDTGNKRIVSFDSDGKQLNAWGKEGSKPGEFIEPVGIAVDSQGTVIVADTGNRRMQFFDKDGTYLREYAILGWEEFYTEPYIAVSGTDLIATDSYNHRCARYTNDVLSFSWGGSGTAAGKFNRPIGIAADGVGGFYVSDTLNHRIQKFVLPASQPPVGGEQQGESSSQPPVGGEQEPEPSSQ